MDTPRLLAAYQQLNRANKLDADQAEQLKQLTLAKNEQLLALVSLLDSKPWEDAFTEQVLAILSAASSSSSSSSSSSTSSTSDDEPKQKKLVPSGGSNASKKKPMALNITVVQAANASVVAVEADQEETHNSQLLKQKRINPGKRRTMPVEKMLVPADKLNAEAKQAQD